MRWSRYRKRSTWPVPPRKPAVQVSQQELLAARVIELGLAPATAGKSFDCDFPASLVAARQRLSSHAARTGCVVQDRHRSRWFFAPRERTSVRLSKRESLTEAANRSTPQCNMDVSTEQ